MTEYALIATNKYARLLKKIKKKSPQLLVILKEKTSLLKADPFSLPLRTHKVNVREFGECFASRITGDVRLLWQFDENNNLIILLLSIGGHEGKRGVY